MMDFWHVEFMRNTLVSALILGPACALLGVFVTLRGMAFFSDALAHSAITGVALGYLLQEWLHWNVDPMLFVLLFSLVLATVMAYFFDRTKLRPDTIIAFSFTGSVALGYLIISCGLGKYRLIDGILFGSIYSNSLQDIFRQAVLALAIVGILFYNLKSYALGILQPDLARVQGIRLERLNYLFALLVAATVTVCLKMVGALLLSALIVIPPAAAKVMAGNFRNMLLLAPVLGLLAAVCGVLLSFKVNAPSGPVMVLVNVGFLLGSLVVAGLQRRRRPA